MKEAAQNQYRFLHLNPKNKDNDFNASGKSQSCTVSELIPDLIILEKSCLSPSVKAISS